MSTRPDPNAAFPRLHALLQDAVRQAQDLMDALLRQAREALQRDAGQTRDLDEREARRRAFLALVQASPDLRQRFPEALGLAFERALEEHPSTTTHDTAPVSIRFDQLELMDERQVQARISAVRGVQQVLLESEAELSELHALVSALMGYAQVRPERNPLRPEVFLDALQDLLRELAGDARTQALWAQSLLPLLGGQLRGLYANLLAQLRRQQVQPARYVISQTVQGGGTRAPRAAAGAAGAAIPVAASAAAPVMPAPPPAGTRLTVQQLHGLVSGAAVDTAPLAQEVVNLLIANIAGDPRILPPVWQLVYELEPALLALARRDLNFFHDKQHPARVLLEDIVQRSFAYDSETAPGFEDFMAHLRLALHDIDPQHADSPAPFAAALQRLRRHWDQAERVREAAREAAVQALQQAEQRNALARQIADYVRAQPGTVLVPDAVVAFACGPWAQVMAQARLDEAAGRSDAFDPVALLEDLFWSVRPDQTRAQPAELVRLIPQLVQGLRQGLERIHYPVEQAQAFLDQLFALHQGGLEGISAARSLRVAPVPATPTWLAPEEARDSGFMDDLGGGDEGAAREDFPATEPAAFAATEPMALPPLQAGAGAGQAPPQGGPADGALALASLPVGSWLELQADGRWLRLQLEWVNDVGTLCLFGGAQGTNHSMTQRMFDRLVAQGQLRLVSQGAVVERAFDAVAELAMRNSVYMDIQDTPG